jgi:hypothetical protein
LLLTVRFITPVVRDSGEVSVDVVFHCPLSELKSLNTGVK